MEFWAIDETTTIIVIKFSDGVLHLVEAKYLLWFRERDIHTLARHQTFCKSELMEPAAKEFIGMVATIIEKRLWLGVMGKSDVMLFKKI